MKNHYQSLGIERSSSQDEIRQAYRKLALKFHPDKNNGDKFFEEQFKKIQEAYEILSNAYEKGKYDSEFDRFFSQTKSYQHTYTNQSQQQKKEEPAIDPEELKRRKEQAERLAKEAAQQKKARELKRKADLPFEDKAWIGIGSGFTVGIVGVIMFFKYLAEGYNKKSQQVCVAAIVGVITLLLLSVLLTLAESGNGH